MMNGEQKGSLKEKWYEVYRKLSLRQIIWSYFTITALIATMLIGFSFYGRFSSQAQDIIQEENRKLLEQVGNNCGSYIRNMMKVSDTLYYSVIKKSNLSTDSLSESFQLLYDTNKENIESISLFSLSGELLEVAPAAVLKQNAEIRKQEWFSLAMSERENLHFSTPMVSNIFSTQDAEYSWVIPLSRAVQITRGNSVQTGVLLINLRHSGLEDVFNNVLLGENAYIYLADRQGELIYHPNMQLISSGIMEENNYETATKKDGNHTEKFNGVKTDFVIKSLGYTGWKIVGVTPQSSVILGSFKSNVFVLFMACFFLTALTIIYSYISKRVSAPILSLEQSVKKLEDGNWDTDIEISGFYEVRHLGN
ncbi:MAG: cache domain-containing protein, partial [Anaerotignaceae bacterium]